MSKILLSIAVAVLIATVAFQFGRVQGLQYANDVLESNIESQIVNIKALKTHGHTNEAQLVKVTVNFLDEIEMDNLEIIRFKTYIRIFVGNQSIGDWTNSTTVDLIEYLEDISKSKIVNVEVE